MKRYNLAVLAVFTTALLQAIKNTGNGSPEFDPQQWLNEERTKCTVNEEMGNFVFGKGQRNCIGRNLAVAEMVTILAILGREVSSVQMTQEEQERAFFTVGDHPTGLPLKLIPRQA
jgi:cytochrome P450